MILVGVLSWLCTTGWLNRLGGEWHSSTLAHMRALDSMDPDSEWNG